MTRGYQLPSRYVIHTVGPIWRGGRAGEREQLMSCYRESLALAVSKRCRSVAFPLISAGVYGYPKAEALRVAMEAIGEFLMEHELLVYLVIFDKASFAIGEKLFSDIATYIDDRYVAEHEDSDRFVQQRKCRIDSMPMAAPKSSLEEAVSRLDESFSQMLLRKIDEKGLKDSECYKKANVDRKLFSKIRKDEHYRPSKPTAIAFAIALELGMEETEELLRKAGYALSHSNRFDIIIEYFISRGQYDIFQINEALFAFDQSLLGV